jgi:hypothetical protein
MGSTIEDLKEKEFEKVEHKISSISKSRKIKKLSFPQMGGGPHNLQDLI